MLIAIATGIRTMTRVENCRLTQPVTRCISPGLLCGTRPGRDERGPRDHSLARLAGGRQPFCEPEAEGDHVAQAAAGTRRTPLLQELPNSRQDDITQRPAPGPGR